MCHIVPISRIYPPPSPKKCQMGGGRAYMEFLPGLLFNFILRKCSCKSALSMVWPLLSPGANTWEFLGAKNWTLILELFGQLRDIPAKFGGLSRQKVVFPWLQGTYRTFWPPKCLGGRYLSGCYHSTSPRKVDISKPPCGWMCLDIRVTSKFEWYRQTGAAYVSCLSRSSPFVVARRERDWTGRRREQHKECVKERERERDKRATTNVQNGLVFFFLFSNEKKRP